MEYKVLNNGLKMPMVGLGVYNISERETQRVVEILKFLIQNGIIIIPKTTHKERMVENINLFDFTLSDEDLREICLLDTGRNVTGWPSDALKYNPESV